MSLLEAKGITLVLGGRTILSDVDAAVAAGTVVGLIGPNGAGKTSLIRIMSGLAQPTRGEVLLDGVALKRIAPKARAQSMAYLSQHPAAGFGFQVSEVVAMGRYPHRGRFQAMSADDRAAIEEAMAATGVAALASRPITKLSGGERQRVFLARALAQRPRVLFLDEPTSNLDVRYQLEIMSLVQQLNRERGLTVVMAIHDLTWAARYCTHLLALARGRRVAFGPVDEVFGEDLIERVFEVRGTVRRQGGVPIGVDLAAPKQAVDATLDR